MRVVARRPAAPLREHVRSIWFFEGPAIPHAMERILPSGAMQLLVNLEEDVLRWFPSAPRPCGGDDRAQTLPGAALAGAFSRGFAIDTAQQRVITGVRLTPGGASAFFGGSMRDFANTHVPLPMLPGGASVRDRLLEARQRGPERVLDAWERILRKRWQTRERAGSTPMRARAMRAARARLEAGSAVQEVADALSISVRKLRQDFGGAIGLSPKAYARVARFQRLVQTVAAQTAAGSGGERDWAGLAIAHGYFDQSHMIHDFRALTGLTPSQYLPRDPEDWNHVALPHADSSNTDEEEPARSSA